MFTITNYTYLPITYYNFFVRIHTYWIRFIYALYALYTLFTLLYVILGFLCVSEKT